MNQGVWLIDWLIDFHVPIVYLFIYVVTIIDAVKVGSNEESLSNNLIDWYPW